MQELTFDLPDQHATEELARRLAGAARPGCHPALRVLGAGKSVFSRAFLRAACGDPDMEVPGPPLVQNYDAPAGDRAFRSVAAGGAGRLHELGWDDASRASCWWEMARSAGALAPADALRITLSVTGGRRGARIAGWDDRPVWAGLAAGEAA
jgi:tRNA threonylcarbamoyladenosine biosynthesis protein TsaE